MKNITLKEYSESRDASRYDNMLEHLNPNNTFAGHVMDINQMPYANVKYCIKLLPKAVNWEVITRLFEICFDVKPDVFWQQPITDYFAAKKYILNEFERVIKTEAKALVSVSTDMAMWKMAGAERLDAFSDTLPLIQLGEKFGIYPFDIGRKPYSEVFSLLVQIKVQNEVEKEYVKLTTKK